VAVLLLDALAADILRRDAVDGVRIVGVDGPSGSGKSTFAQRLAVALGAPVVEVDDFLSWDDLHGWWPRFEAQVLTPLFTGHDARFQVRDWEKDELGTSLYPAGRCFAPRIPRLGRRTGAVAAAPRHPARR